MDPTIVGSKGKIKLYRTNKLGAGGFGKVFEGKFNGKKVAVKRIEIEDFEEYKSPNYEKELHAIKESDHKNIVRYLFDDKDDNFFYLVMEFCEFSLYRYFELKGYDIISNEQALLKILFHATSGVTDLHNRGIYHRDIKPQNHLVFKNGDEVFIKLADFGVCKVVDANTTTTSLKIKGTYGYHATEVCTKGLRIKSPKSDIFSLGLVFHEIASKGKHPFGEDNFEAEGQIKKQEPPNISRDISQSLKELITKMVDHNCTSRPTGKEVANALERIVPDVNLDSPIQSSLFDWKKRKNEETSEDGNQAVGDNCANKYDKKPRLDEDTIEEREIITETPFVSAASEPIYDKEQRGSKIPDYARIDVKQSLEIYAGQGDIKESLEEDPKNPVMFLATAEYALTNTGDFAKADKCMIKATNCLSSYKTLTTAIFLKYAKSSASAGRFVRSTILQLCAASQCRREKTLIEASKTICSSIYEVYERGKDMLKDLKGIEETEIHYKNIVKNFVLPQTEQLYSQLEDMAKYIPRHRRANALSWMTILFNLAEGYEKAGELANDGIRLMEEEYGTARSRAFQLSARLWQGLGESKMNLGQGIEAKENLETARTCVKMATDYKNKARQSTALRFVENLICQNNANLMYTSS